MNQQPVTSNILLGRLHKLRYSAFINAFAVAKEKPRGDPRAFLWRTTAALINGFPAVEGEMGTCSYCGTPFPKTRKTRKYCTNRCRTNACLDKKPRLRAAEVEAIHEILHSDFASVEAMRESLRSIVAPDLPAIPLIDGRIAIPRLD